MQRSPAVLPLCGLNTAGEPCERQSRVKAWIYTCQYTYPSEVHFWGGCALVPPRKIQRVPWIFGVQEASKRPSRGLLFSICFLMPFWTDFLSIFLANMSLSWPPKSTKIHEKSMPGGLPKLRAIFDRFLIDFYSQLGSCEPHLALAG